MQLTRFGHAALLVEHDDTRVLLDPGSYSVDEAFDLDGLDAIVVTHQHADHIDAARVTRLVDRNPDALLLCERETLPGLDGSWTEARPGSSTTVGSLELHVVGGRHAVIHPDLPGVGNVGVVLAALEGPSVFHPGDAYDEAPGGVDVLALPLTAPWAKLSETVEFVRRVAPRSLIPIHDRALAAVGYDVYWNTVARLGGAAAERLGPTDTLAFQ